MAAQGGGGGLDDLARGAMLEAGGFVASQAHSGSLSLHQFFLKALRSVTPALGPLFHCQAFPTPSLLVPQWEPSFLHLVAIRAPTYLQEAKGGGSPVSINRWTSKPKWNMCVWNITCP